jgi:hypothetical protein
LSASTPNRTGATTPRSEREPGDNLDVLREYVGPESVDLVYLDPPFKSNQDYNVLFREHDGTWAAAQMRAFEDTWSWDEAAHDACRDVIARGGPVADGVQALRTCLGDSDMMAYLAMMAPRLIELYRVLKPSGSIYLHCDSTASHYLKMLMVGLAGILDMRRNDPVGHRSRPTPSGSATRGASRSIAARSTASGARRARRQASPDCRCAICDVRADPNCSKPARRCTR